MSSDSARPVQSSSSAQTTLTRPLIWSFALVFVVAMLAFSTKPSENKIPDSSAWFACLLILPMVVMLLNAMSARSGAGFWLSPSGLGLVFLWSSVLGVPILWRCGLATPWDDFSADPDTVISVSLLCMAVITAGVYVFGTGFNSKTIRYIPKTPGALSSLLLVSMAVGLLGLAVLLFSVGGVTALVSSLSTRRDALSGLGILTAVAAVPGAAAIFGMLVPETSTAQRLLIAGASFEFLFYLFVSGSRFPLIAFVLSLLVARAHRMRIPSVVFGAVGAIAAPFSVWYAVAVRQTSQGATSSSTFGGATVREYVSSVTDPFVFGGLDVLRTLGAVVNDTPEMFQDGSGKLIGGSATLVPRFLWPDKPDGLSIGFSQEYFADRWAAGTGVPPSILAEAGYLFGQFGGLIYLLALGVFLGWSTRKMWTSSSAFLRVSGVFLTTDVIVLTKSGSDSFLRLLMLHCLAASFVALLARTTGFRAVLEDHEVSP